MTDRPRYGVFVAEGTSDMPISDIVEDLFFERGTAVHLSKPDFNRLEKVSKDVRSRLLAGRTLADNSIDFFVVHRDADNAGPTARRREIEEAVAALTPTPALVPVIPVRMTEAWLLLDESAIRTVAGNPRGRTRLDLPKLHEVERHPDPKALLRKCLLDAAEVTGRRRDRMAARFSQHRAQLLERLDRKGPVIQLSSWKELVADIDAVVDLWTST